MTDAALVTRVEASILCDVSAAAHWNLPLPPWIGRELENRPVGVAVVAEGSRQRRPGVRGRRLDLPDEHVVPAGIARVTTPARTWLDCAEFLPVEHLVAMGDVILRRGLATRDELRAIVHWGFRRRGMKTARRALPILDPGAESPGESHMRCVLVLRKVPPPACNLEVVVNGVFVARVDLAWDEVRLAAEYDGAVHLPEEQRRKDATRRNLLQDAGWTVVVFTAADLKHPDRMAELVLSALARTRGSAGRPSAHRRC